MDFYGTNKKKESRSIRYMVAYKTEESNTEIETQFVSDVSISGAIQQVKDGETSVVTEICSVWTLVQDGGSHE